jgi:hypothetical protein
MKCRTTIAVEKDKRRSVASINKLAAILTNSIDKQPKYGTFGIGKKSI